MLAFTSQLGRLRPVSVEANDLTSLETGVTYFEQWMAHGRSAVNVSCYCDAVRRPVSLFVRSISCSVLCSQGGEQVSCVQDTGLRLAVYSVRRVCVWVFRSVHTLSGLAPSIGLWVPLSVPLWG